MARRCNTVPPAFILSTRRRPRQAIAKRNRERIRLLPIRGQQRRHLRPVVIVEGFHQFFPQIERESLNVRACRGIVDFFATLRNVLNGIGDQPALALVEAGVSRKRTSCEKLTFIESPAWKPLA